ncbi:MAG: glycine C-acetyltransferase [Spirochaetia bacterium]|nr:glycine C-acetyltransferase [Spirochaetia bacterium]MCF7941721.1 glycine C-acetyltransferase [Spirochaetia bacterium]
MFGTMKDDLKRLFTELEEQGLYKHERVIDSPQGAHITVQEGAEVLNFCANNYLGLADEPAVIRGAAEAMERWGYGLSSVRFICGTQGLHKELEGRMSRFLGTEDTILYAACFDANGGLFEPLLSSEDALISDQLNHASIIDGVRLCKARRYRYAHSDMKDLERCLKESGDARYRLIATDGVFSMDGDIARLHEICDLAERYDALVMVDDSHATGFIGETGRGTSEYCGVLGRVDIITTTFGKALGGASGGCTSGRKEIIELLRQRSRPYLFSNTLAPAVAGGTLAVLDLLEASTQRRDRLMASAARFKSAIKKMGFTIVDGETPIVPVMLHDEVTAVTMADLLLKEGIYVIGFVYPVVPKGSARIRVQISAAHSPEDLDTALAAFEKVGRVMGILPA